MAVTRTSEQEREEQVRREQTLIERWIEPRNGKPGHAESVVAGYGVSVWALVNRWLHADGDVAQVMASYDLPEDAMRAVLAYYRRHKAVIDARILLEEDMWGDRR